MFVINSKSIGNQVLSFFLTFYLFEVGPRFGRVNVLNFDRWYNSLKETKNSVGCLSSRREIGEIWYGSSKVIGVRVAFTQTNSGGSTKGNIEFFKSFDDKSE